MDKKNRERNYLSITQFLAKALFMGIGISNVLVKAKESTIFVIILGTLFGCFLLTLLNKFNYKEVKSFRKWVNVISFLYLDCLYCFYRFKFI